MALPSYTCGYVALNEYLGDELLDPVSGTSGHLVMVMYNGPALVYVWICCFERIPALPVCFDLASVPDLRVLTRLGVAHFSCIITRPELHFATRWFSTGIPHLHNCPADSLAVTTTNRSFKDDKLFWIIQFLAWGQLILFWGICLIKGPYFVLCGERTTLVLTQR